MVLKASMDFALADLSFLYGTKGEVSSTSAESSGVSLFVNDFGSDEGWLRLGSFPAFRCGFL